MKKIKVIPVISCQYLQSP